MAIFCDSLIHCILMQDRKKSHDISRIRLGLIFIAIGLELRIALPGIRWGGFSQLILVFVHHIYSCLILPMVNCKIDFPLHLQK